MLFGLSQHSTWFSNGASETKVNRHAAVETKAELVEVGHAFAVVCIDQRVLKLTIALCVQIPSSNFFDTIWTPQVTSITVALDKASEEKRLFNNLLKCLTPKIRKSLRPH